jgi:hypothetical protein
MRFDPSTLSLTPMDLEQAMALVRRLRACYPSALLSDPEVYIAEVVALLCGYPLWAGERAINRVSETVKFIPSKAEIKPVLEDQVRAHRYAAEWEAGARATEARLAGPDFSDEAYRTRMRENLEGLSAELRSANTERKPPKTLAQLREELIAAIGQEAFDAIPDAKHPWPTAGEAMTELLRKRA